MFYLVTITDNENLLVGIRVLLAVAFVLNLALAGALSVGCA